ncbi:MAG: hypothetical protein IKH25_11480 [Muribaculaceae bacterium]|nr:hypothetical protein [Muribaculaceae bacterium]
MKGFGKFCIWLGALSLIGALIGGHSAFGPAFWLALGLALVFFAKQKEDVNRKMDKQTTNPSASATQPVKEIQQQIRIETAVKSQPVESKVAPSNTSKDIPMTTKQKEAAICLVSFFGGYNDLETNDEANQIVFELSCQVANYFGIHDFPAMLPGAMKRNSDPNKIIDTVMTIQDRQYRECLLLTCYDLAKMSMNPEAMELIFNIANDMGYNNDRFNSLIKQYSH